MKELSIEEKAKAYDEAYEKAVVRFGSNVADEIFLKYSEEERIRKEIISALKYANFKGVYDKHIAWLEKQGEQKPVVVPKFKVGDVIKDTEDGEVFTIRTITKDKYIYTDDSFDWIKDQEGYELVEQKPAEWNILSAKKGDMLSNGTIVLIVDSIEKFEGRPIINSWYFADSEKFYGKGTSECDRWEVNGFRIATEAECNYLLKMMSDAGYVWNAEKKELNKIENPLLSDFFKAEYERGKSDAIKCVKWGEEDEEMHRKCICAMRASACGFPEEEKFVEEVDNWFKSLKERYNWRPSDEQMERLNILTIED